MVYCVGVDLGGTSIKAGLIDERGNITGSCEIPTGVEANSAEIVMDNIKKSINQIISKNKNKEIKAIGVGIPGIAMESGRITIFANIRVFTNYPMAKEIEKDFQIPVFVDNDANNAARGEYIFGAGKGKKNFILITLGTGIGGGIFINGDIYSGFSGAAGEIGHMTIIPDGKQCGCGNFGCWETYGSASAMIKSAKALIGRNIKTSIEKYYPDRIDAKVITDEAKSGDPVASEIFEETTRYIGIGIANLISIFNPELCILGGGLSKAGEFLLNKVKFYSNLSAVPMACSAADICLAKLENQAGILGAAALAFMK